MGDESKTWRVGIVGLNPIGLFLLEQFRLIPNVRVVGIYDRDPSRCHLANELDCRVWDHPAQAFSATDVDAVVLADQVSSESIAMGLQNGKHLVVDRPWGVSSREWRELSETAGRSSAQLTFVCLRRWSSDFPTVLVAMRSGRVGTLQSARYVSHEMCLASELAAPRFLTEIAFSLLDQLLLLTASNPKDVFAKRLGSAAGGEDTGLIATIEFENGCVAQIDLQSQSRLSQRTGWMLEGAQGSYRDDRLYTVTTDGEVIDEPLSPPNMPDNSFVRELVASWNGEASSLPSLTEAVRTVQLAEMIERSAERRDVVRS
ncbi:Gfo/Idh/MocA family protein [Schlesneria paludicola]|uniref:Gfo/Idh/MocA family protein n=1 Tax=Schlesneria paludicola TaxID=360056 RepID=UPI00029A4D3E|nr:Gfo/Idh/MocA family oxidoreductase [Schlesneria paludicola]